jgi:hypothetical protein
MKNAIDFANLSAGILGLVSDIELEFNSHKRQLDAANALIEKQRAEIAASDNLIMSLTDKVLSRNRQRSKLVEADQRGDNNGLGAAAQAELTKELSEQLKKLAAFAASLNITE